MAPFGSFAPAVLLIRPALDRTRDMIARVAGATVVSILYPMRGLLQVVRKLDRRPVGVHVAEITAYFLHDLR